MRLNSRFRVEWVAELSDDPVALALIAREGSSEGDEHVVVTADARMYIFDMSGQLLSSATLRADGEPRAVATGVVDAQFVVVVVTSEAVEAYQIVL